MNYSKSDNKLNFKDYLFLSICLLIFFIGRVFLIEGNDFPEGNEFIYVGITVLIFIPTVIYILKKINDY